MRLSQNDAGRIKLILARVLVYALLIFVTFLCLFPFYLLVINATRSNAQLQGGQAHVPGDPELFLQRSFPEPPGSVTVDHITYSNPEGF